MNKKDIVKVTKDVKRLNRFVKFSSVVSVISKLMTAAFVVFALADTFSAVKKAV